MTKIIDLLKDKAKLHATYIRVFDNPDGKLVLRHLMDSGFIIKSTYVSGDPYTTALNEGSRRIVLSILKFIHRDHKQLMDEIERVMNDTTNG